MKKLFLAALLAFAGYKLYQGGFSPFSPTGAFDESGKPLVVLFVGPGCGAPCDEVRSTLKSRKMSYEEINVVGADGAPADHKYGVRSFPTTLIGSQEILGNDVQKITAALAETFGKEVLSRKETRAMDGHFDADGRPQVVMYATKWCQYCKAQREYFAANRVPYKEIDVEASQSNTLLYNALEGRGYPLIYVGYRRFGGYTEGPLLAAVNEAEKSGARR
jgi:glutaredoxin